MLPHMSNLPWLINFLVYSSLIIFMFISIKPTGKSQMIDKMNSKIINAHQKWLW